MTLFINNQHLAAALRTMEIVDLATIYRAFKGQISAVEATQNLPRCTVEANALLESLQCELDDSLALVVSELRGRQPQDCDDRYEQFRSLLDYTAMMASTPDEVAEFLKDVSQ